MGKSLLRSKTAWANFAIAVLVAVGVHFEIPYLNDPQVIGYVTAGVNFLLRLITKQPISGVA